MGAEHEGLRRRRLTGLLPVVVGVVLAMMVGAALFVLLTGVRAAGTARSTDAAAELEPVVELFDALTTDAVDAPDAEKLAQAAIDGMLEQLDDQYASYFAEQDFA
jgi:flagellar basal body-associated protein FliL